MSTADIALTIFILWVFGCINGFNKLMANVNKIKKDWPDYRCKMSIMPFANVLGPDGTSTTDNFNWCIQNIAQVFAGNSLSSLSPGFNANASGIAKAGTGLDTIAQSMKCLKSNTKKNIGSMFNIYVNIIMEFEQMMASMKSTMKGVTTGGDTVKNIFTSAQDGIKKGFENVMHAITHVP